jgi:hypothetical protein
MLSRDASLPSVSGYRKRETSAAVTRVLVVVDAECIRKGVMGYGNETNRMQVLAT